MFCYQMLEESIGQQLKQAREARVLTFKKVTQATHIQTRLLEAMEADDFESLPSPVQARAFLRLYAEFLELNLDDLIARQRSGLDPSKADLQAMAPIADQLPEPLIAPENEVAAKPVRKLIPHKSKFNPSENARNIISNVRHGVRKHKTVSPYIEANEPGPSSEPEMKIAAPVPAPKKSADEVRSGQPEELFLPEKDKIGPPPASQLIFSSIGGALHQRREALSLTLEEVENHTHVRKHYLQALEAGDFDQLPSSVQTRGMVSNYAHFLDMDVEAVLLTFAEGLQAQRLERQSASPVEAPKAKTRLPPHLHLPASLRNYFSLDVFVGVGLIVVLLGFAFWGTGRIIGLRSAVTPQATALSISDILVASPAAGTPTPLPTNVTGTNAIQPAQGATVGVTVPAAGSGPVQVVLVALEQAFVRVTVDSKILFEGRVVAGTAYPFDANSQIEVLTGNGAAVSILFNQSDLGPMGTFGEVVDRIYTANAILNPTATATPTPTITPIPSATPRFSQTPSPTSPAATPKTTAAGQ